MTLYPAIAVMSFRRTAAYRAATLAGLATNLFFGMLRAFVFLAVFDASEGTHIAGYSLPQAITYAALTQAMIAPLMAFGWWDVMRTIRTGDIVGDLTKPIDFYALWLARDLGRAAMSVLTRGVPILVVFPLFWDLVWPSSAGAWLAFGLSALLAILLSFSWRFLVNVSAFWTMDAYGLGRVAFMAVLLFSGFVIPVAFFPDWLQSIARALPFHAMVNTPAEVYLGIREGGAAAAAIAVQALWVVVLAAAARLAYRRGVARLVVQGG